MKPTPRCVCSVTARTAAAVVTAALLAAACSGSASSKDGGRSPASRSTVAFAQCVRSHGVPNYPDPESNGNLPKETPQQLGVSSSQLQSATQPCEHLLPSSGGRTAAQVQQEWSGMLSFARCMRSHGVPNWPDPTHYPPRPTDPTFILPASIQPIPQTISRMNECLRLVPDNEVLGHIDNDNWSSVQQQMAGS